MVLLMGRFLKNYLGPFLLSVITTALLACFFQTQNVLSGLKQVGADVGFSDRVAQTFFDIKSLGPLYAVFISIAFLIAFLAAGLFSMLAPKLSKYIFAGAGAVAMIVMLFAMKAAFFDVHIIAGARDLFGQILQMLAGALGGLLFYKLRRKSKPKTIKA